MARLADIAVALWVVFVGVAYFGPVIMPQIWSYPSALQAVYGAMLIAAVAALSLGWLRRSPEPQPKKAKR